MSQKLYGSICVSDLIDKAKEGHSAFSKSEKNGKIYANVQIWLNDEKDKYGNDASVMLASKKEKKDSEGKVYLGNLKISEYSGAEITATDKDSLTVELPSTVTAAADLPF